jgi:hypothetical protein
MKDSADDGYFLRNFEDLIYDAVHLLYRAIDENIENDHDGYGFTFTRTSILNSLLLFECGRTAV